MHPSPYQVLGLTATCSPVDIRTAYKRLALALHPDKVAESSREAATLAFQDINNAYHLLSDHQKRADYDHHQLLSRKPRNNDVVTRRSSAPRNHPNTPTTTNVPVNTRSYTSSFKFVDLDLHSYMSECKFSGFSGSTGFYEVYGKVFEKVYNQEVVFLQKIVYGWTGPPPCFGNRGSGREVTARFYDYWLGFSTVIDFEWVDDEVLRVGAKEKYNKSVRELAMFVNSIDKRVPAKNKAKKRARK